MTEKAEAWAGVVWRWVVVLAGVLFCVALFAVIAHMATNLVQLWSGC